MRKTILALTAVFAVLSLGASARAAGGALDELGGQTAAVPGVPAPAAAAAAKAQAPDIDLFSYFGYAKRPAPQAMLPARFPKGAARGPVATIDLESIRDVYLKPGVFFTTGAGTKVYVSGTKAANCPDGGNSCKDKEKFFLVLTTDKNQSYFVRAMEIINWSIFMSGSKTVTIDGEKYTVKAYANASTPENSRVEITGPRGAALNSTLKQIGDAVAAKGVDVTLSKAYKLAYGNEIVQGPQGTKFTPKMLVLLIPYPVVDASSYFILNADDIKPAGITFPQFESGYGFKLNGGKLSIYKI